MVNARESEMKNVREIFGNEKKDMKVRTSAFGVQHDGKQLAWR